jgi:periplasmic protein CpxP/Spy
MSTSASPFLRAFAVTALLGGLALATPSFAASPSSSSGSDSGMGMSSSSGSGGGKSGMDMSQKVEDRIQTLHDKLQITPQQESEWNDVAQAMRDNESSIHQAIEARWKGAKTMSAVDDLQSYQKIAQAHADGMGKLISAFSTLYDDMSPTQQKNADQVFGQFEGHRGAMKASASGKKAAPSSSGTPDNE